MSKASTSQIVQLLSRAATDPGFRDQLIQSPEAAAQHLGIELDVSDVEKLEQVAEHVQRFGGHPHLNEIDAQFWAVGLIAHIEDLLVPWVEDEGEVA